MGPSKRVVIIAGEASGDLLGSGLMEALKKQSGQEIDFQGVGGDLMQAQGLRSFFPMGDINLLGVVEIVRHLPRVLRRLSQTTDQIRALKPDVVITIDAPAFTMRLHKRLKGTGIKIVHYVAPTVWAWAPGRAKTLAQHVDHLLTLYPFEAPYFERHGLATTFVGHGVTALGIDRADGPGFRKRHGISEQSPLVCVLPGSRRSELDNLCPVFKEVVRQLAVTVPGIRFVLPTLPHRRALVESHIHDWDVPLIITDDGAEKYAAFRASTLAVAASGTVALELACASLPMLICYKVNWLTAFLARYLLKVPYICMINLLLNRLVVPEFVQERCVAEAIYPAALDLLTHETARSAMVQDMHQAVALLTSPDCMSPADKAAAVVTGIWDR